MKNILKKFREEFELKLLVGLCVALISIILLTMKFPTFPMVRAYIFAIGATVILFAIHKLLNYIE